MLSYDDLGLLEAKTVCCNCIGEAYLKNDIERRGEYGWCHYCEGHGYCISLSDLTNFTLRAFEEHYYETRSKPNLYESVRMQIDRSYQWERDGAPIVDAICNAIYLLDDRIAYDIQKLLADRRYDLDCGAELAFTQDSYYQKVEPNADRWVKNWANFEDALKKETRFFSQSASMLLKSIFHGIDSIKTTDGKPLILEGGPNTRFNKVYRARCFQSDEHLKEALRKPDKALGPPPPESARSGRMNAQGISVFYGATKPKVALAEIRPPVGSKVVTARFKIIRNIKLLNLTALETVAPPTGSIFDPTYIDKIERSIFLRTLSSKMIMPVMPNNETLEYLPTQAIADFLSSENRPQLDGIVFKSVQAGGNALNAVLFHKASAVRQLPEPDISDVKITDVDKKKRNMVSR